MTPNDQNSESGMIGRTIARRYRIDQRIARGGMGVVYVGEHLRLKRPIVFKVLSEHLADDEKATARFEQEALGLSRLNHPNIVTVYDFGTEEGLTYIVMEFVPGRTLSQVLRDEGVMTFDRLLPLAVQIVQAIGAAHQKDIVHRDIKPANIMVVSEPGRSDVVKVLDFGLARLTSSSLDITKDNLVGTVSYVAPEVVKGARAGKAADVYALAVMFYFMLTGQKPFKAEDDLSVLYKHVHDKPVPMSELLHDGHDVPLAFMDLIERCMAKDPADRPADGSALLGELSEVVSLPSIPRISSGEFVEIQRAAAAAARQRQATPGPMSSMPPADIPAEAMVPVPSMELSSVALRERPNSRWGIPLIALCVFVAGAAGILLIADVGGEAPPESGSEVNWGAVDTSGAKKGRAPAGEPISEGADEADKTLGGGANLEDNTTGAAADSDGTRKGTTGSKSAKRQNTRKPVNSKAGAKSAESGQVGDTDESARPSQTGESTESNAPEGLEGTKAGTSPDEPNEVEPLPPNDSSPELLDVDNSSDSILLPVD